MVKCEVADCGNYPNRPAMDGEIRFFSFPSEPNRRLAWRLAAGCSPNAVLIGKPFVCSKHFLESAYHMKEKIMGLPFNTWKLDKSAVPTEFLPESAVIASESSERSERQAKRSRKRLVEDLLRDDEEKENEVERSEVMDTSSDNETLTQTDEEFPFTSKCRMCLAELNTDSGEVINIFAVDNRDNSTIAKWVADHLNLELLDSPEYPSLICRGCSDNIQLIETFRNTIINSQCYFSDEIPPLVHVNVEMIDRVDDKPDVDDSQSPCIVEEEEGHGDSEDAAIEPETSELSEKQTQRMINCTQCQGSFSSRKELKQHKATHSAGDRRIYPCSYCPKKFNKLEGRTRHIQRVHEKVQRCVCEECGKAFTSLGSLWDHKQRHKKENSGQNKNRKRSHASEEGINLGEFTYCSICMKGVTYIRLHYKSVHGKEYQPTEFDLEMVPCKYCDEQVKRIRMTGHYKGKHRRKRIWVCEFCQEEFKRYTTYQVHLDRHLNRKYPCMYCEKVNETQQGRYLHIRNHHPDKYVAQVAKQKSYGMVKEDAEEN